MLQKRPVSRRLNIYASLTSSVSPSYFHLLSLGFGFFAAHMRIKTSHSIKLTRGKLLNTGVAHKEIAGGATALILPRRVSVDLAGLSCKIIFRRGGKRQIMKFVSFVTMS